MQLTADSPKIKRWREERHWSQEHLADIAGIGVRTVQRIERGDQASRESLMALAAAFNVDVTALTSDARAEAEENVRRQSTRKLAALRLSFWISLASYLFGMVLFAGINMGTGSSVMLWPAIWWTVGTAGHGLAVVITELAVRYQLQAGADD